jgi:predicted phosphoribosyltransferase
LYTPEEFWGIGQFYEEFKAVEDEEVLRLLRKVAPAAP